MNCLTNYFNHLISFDSLHYLPTGIIGSFFLFLIYLEASPRIGNVWYRMSDDGRRHLNVSSLLHFLFRPFRDITFWKPSMWDLNVVVFTLLGSGIYMIIRRSIEFKIC